MSVCLYSINVQIAESCIKYIKNCDSLSFTVRIRSYIGTSLLKLGVVWFEPSNKQYQQSYKRYTLYLGKNHQTTKIYILHLDFYMLYYSKYILQSIGTKLFMATQMTPWKVFRSSNLNNFPRKKCRKYFFKKYKWGKISINQTLPCYICE